MEADVGAGFDLATIIGLSATCDTESELSEMESCTVEPKF